MVVLVTGASGGLGRVLGATLVEKGMAVYGTMRDPARNEAPCPFPLLALEVTDPGSVEKCVSQVLEREGRIDVLVNCVNQMIIGSVEEVEALYATNVFGVLRICKQVIPVAYKLSAYSLASAGPGETALRCCGNVLPGPCDGRGPPAESGE